MATRAVVLSDVLCFVVNKLLNTDKNILKTALFDFYSVDELHVGRMRLVGDADSLFNDLISKRPHIPHRRDGDGRLQKEVDDLILLVTFLDEQKVLDRLPIYAASSSDRMPSLRIHQGDLGAVMSLLHSMDNKFAEYRSALAAITRDVRAMQARPVSVPVPSLPYVPDTVSSADVDSYGSVAPAKEIPGVITADHGTVNTTDSTGHRPTTMSWAMQMSTPVRTDNPFSSSDN